MKHAIRLLLAMTLVTCLSLGLFRPVAVAKSTYWLSCLSAGPYVGGTGNIIYKGHKIKLTGKWGKGSTMDKASEAAKKKLTKTFKVKSSCKVVEIEEPVKIYQYDHYMDDVNAKKGKKLSFIQAYVRISGGKITRIAFSA